MLVRRYTPLRSELWPRSADCDTYYYCSLDNCPRFP